MEKCWRTGWKGRRMMDTKNCGRQINKRKKNRVGKTDLQQSSWNSKTGGEPILPGPGPSQALRQTCLAQNTSVSTPNSLCPYFHIFDPIFCGCTTNQSKQNSVKGPFFYHSSCKNSVWIHIFNYIYRRTSLRRLYFVYICESRSRLKTAEHFLQKQCTVCAAFPDADASFLEWLLSGQSLFSWFHAFLLLFISFMQPLIMTALNSNLPYVTLHHKMCQAYFCRSKEFAAGVWKCRFWDFGCNCLRNHLSLVCNMEIAHFSVFLGQKHDF